MLYDKTFCISTRFVIIHVQYFENSSSANFANNNALTLICTIEKKEGNLQEVFVEEV